MTSLDIKNHIADTGSVMISKDDMSADLLAELIELRSAAKAAEDKAATERRAVDARIAELLRDPAKTEGSVSAKAGGVKVTVTYGVSRKVDSERVQSEWSQLPAEVQAAFRFKAEVATAALKALAPASAAIAARYIESKPSSPSVALAAA